MKYCKNYCEEEEISTSKLNEAQRTLYYIAENMKMDKSISEEGYKHFQIAIKALKQEPCEDAISRQALLDDFGLSEKTRKWGGDHSGYDTMMLYEIQDMIESEPSVNPQDCDTCEVGNPCLYCKHEFEPQEGANE